MQSTSGGVLRAGGGLKYFFSASVFRTFELAGVVIYLERGADVHMAQLMPLPLTVSCFSKIQIGFTSLVPAHLGSPGQRAVKQVFVCFRSFENLCFCIIALYHAVICWLFLSRELIGTNSRAKYPYFWRYSNFSRLQHFVG